MSDQWVLLQLAQGYRFIFCRQPPTFSELRDLPIADQVKSAKLSQKSVPPPGQRHNREIVRCPSVALHPEVHNRWAVGCIRSYSNCSRTQILSEIHLPGTDSIPKFYLFGLSLTPRIFRRCMQGIHSLLKKVSLGRLAHVVPHEGTGHPWHSQPPSWLYSVSQWLGSINVNSVLDLVLETMGRLLPRTNYLLQEGCFLLGRSTNRMINPKVRALLWNTESFRLLFSDGNF